MTSMLNEAPNSGTCHCGHPRSSHYRDGSEQGGGCDGTQIRDAPVRCRCKGYPEVGAGTVERPASAPEGSDLAAAAAADQDAYARVELSATALRDAREDFKLAQAAYDQASAEQDAAVEAWTEARRAHVAAMRAAGVAQTADGYVTR